VIEHEWKVGQQQNEGHGVLVLQVGFIATTQENGLEA